MAKADDLRSSFGQWVDGMNTVPSLTPESEVCLWGECPKSGADHARNRLTRGFCDKHYLKIRTHFLPKLREKAPDWDDDRFWNEVITPEAPNLSLESESGNGDQADSPIEELASLSESKFQRDLIDELKEAGHGAWYLTPSGVAGGGAPDLLIITKGGKVLLRELKSDTRRLERHQADFLLRIAQRSNLTVGTWQPRDRENGKIRQELD